MIDKLLLCCSKKCFLFVRHFAHGNGSLRSGHHRHRDTDVYPWKSGCHPLQNYQSDPLSHPPTIKTTIGPFSDSPLIFVLFVYVRFLTLAGNMMLMDLA